MLSVLGKVGFTLKGFLFHLSVDLNSVVFMVKHRWELFHFFNVTRIPICHFPLTDTFPAVPRFSASVFVPHVSVFQLKFKHKHSCFCFKLSILI